MKRSLAALLTVFVAGCIFVPRESAMSGRKIQPITKNVPEIPTSSYSLAFAVIDHRPYVVDGARLPEFEGVWRTLVGVPTYASTATDQPLATYVEDRLAAGWNRHGVQVERLPYMSPGTPLETALGECVRASKDRCVVVVLTEWKYDVWRLKRSFQYTSDVAIVERSGRVLAKRAFDGGVDMEAKGHFLDAAQLEYKMALQKMFNDAEITRVLTSN
jgi:hypothetical protein